jgi:hypothetical protein
MTGSWISPVLLLVGFTVEAANAPAPVTGAEPIITYPFSWALIAGCCGLGADEAHDWLNQFHTTRDIRLNLHRLC